MTSPQRAAGARGRGFSPLRDLPAIGWLLAAGVAAVLHADLPAPRWLVIHLVVLGAASHSILVWSQYFADTLLHTPAVPGAARRQTIRLALLNVGALLVMIGVLAARVPLVVVGASPVAAAAAWHAGSLYRQLHRALTARFAMVVRYYVTAAALLPIGALLGTLMITGNGSEDSGRLLVAHVITNVLGWLGITVAGTLVTLWPTMLRTRLVEGAERAATRALPLLGGGVLLSVGMVLAGLRFGAVAGLVVYLAGIWLLAGPFVRTLRAKPASDVATWSLLAGVSWFVLAVAFLAVDLAVASSWGQAHDRLAWVTPAVAAGFAAQMLVGALSYLLPVALGGGPSVARQTNASMRRAGSLRIVLVNGGLVLALLPTPDLITQLGWALVVAGLSGFVLLVLDTSRVARKARAALAESRGDASVRPVRAPVAKDSDAFSGERIRASALVGLAVVALAVAVGVAVGPSTAPSAGNSADMVVVTPTGHTTEVTVVAEGMRFTPSRIEVPAGNRLVITVHNGDPTTSHDLVLESGARTRLLAPGTSERLEAGVLGTDVAGQVVAGWCSVPGHRQMGMVLKIVATGDAQDAGSEPEAGAAGSADSGSPHAGMDMGTGSSSGPATSGPASSGAVVPGPPGAAGLIDLARSPDADFTAHPPELAPVPRDTVHRVTLTAQETVREVAPGVTQLMWTYNGTVPGPILHGRIGDTFEITLRNATTMGHSIDFHAGRVAPDEVMRTIPPGETLHYTFTADHAGIWMYHCSTMPMSVHIANGMFGAVIIDPPDLAPVDQEYVLLQSELYLGEQGGPVDADKVMAERPDLVVFNGYANQYDHRPLTARVGQRVRIWVLDIGPNRATSFHVVGGQFDTVYSEGNYLLRPGTGGGQALGLQVAQGGFVELTFTEAGHYPFVSHVMVDAERGAHGIIEVSP